MTKIAEILTKIKDLETKNEQLKHRLVMVADDLNALRNFITIEELDHIFIRPTSEADNAFTHLNNIEIACDLTNTESLEWTLFSSN
jgi:hypothetical protein